MKIVNGLRKGFDQKSDDMVLNGIEDKDVIGLLAVMCLVCEPFAVQGRLFKRRYSFYVLQDDSNVDFACALFKKTGLDMTVSYRNISVGERQVSLIYKHRNPEAAKKSVSVMDAIQAKTQDIMFDKTNAEWYRLQIIVNQKKLERAKSKHEERQ